MRFHDLGLVIIDEEQRFGVKHKEKLKENFIGVDMLTLSATPIPRTLNMAMSGIRDLSTIEQPPIERQPVETFVLEYNDVILAEAMKKELARGGQVYYLHNRVDNIESTAAHVSQLVPGARVGIAHGKMTEEELNPVWQHLLNGEIDILVCTTLIETGIDVRNCNTLIIEDADRMGLAQLYQIRGRVGRSGRKAYAYFTFRRDKTLTDIAQKRLSAIREFTAFGSGFRIAMRDLQIRGAGSLLGHSQHGHMEAVGYDLYVKMLGQAIARAKGEPVQRDKSECLIDLRLRPRSAQRMGAEQRIAVDRMALYATRRVRCSPAEVEVLRTRNGCVARIHAAGQTFVTLSGSAALAAPVQADTLLASPARPDCVKYDAILSLSSDYRWMPEALSSEQLCHSFSRAEQALREKIGFLSGAVI